MMNKRDFYNNLKLNWETAVITIIIGATIGLYINFILPHYFRANSEFLIMQQQNPNIDAYTAIKGSEQLAYTLKQIILSPAFFQQVIKSNFDINAAYFGPTQEKRVKKWQKALQINTVPNTGILKISVYHPQRKQAQEISQAISSLINYSYQSFLGKNDTINVVALSDTIVSNKFVKPNAIANTLLGLLLGIAASAAYITFAPLPALKPQKKGLALAQTQKKAQAKKNKIRRRNNPLEKKASVPHNLPIV